MQREGTVWRHEVVCLHMYYLIGVLGRGKSKFSSSGMRSAVLFRFFGVYFEKYLMDIEKLFVMHSTNLLP